MKIIKEDTHKKWKDILCSWLGRITISKKFVLLNRIYKFKASFMDDLFHRDKNNNNNDNKIHIEPNSLNNQSNLNKKNKAVLITTPHYKTLTVWYCH
jgi:hypothetical protein